MLLPSSVAGFWLIISVFGGSPPPTVAIAQPGPPQIFDRVKSLTDITTGSVGTLPKLLPKPDDVFSSSKNLLIGYPVDALMMTVNIVCALAMSSSSVKPKSPPKMESMNFILMTRDANYTIPLGEAHKLRHHAAFNTSRRTTVLVTGWTSNVNKSNPALEQVSAAYLCRGGQNFVAIDTGEYVDTLYEWAAFNTEKIGQLIALALKSLTEVYPMEHIHLVGHSLGAHIVGSIGRTYYALTGALFPRITGLDPANPCFNEGFVLSGLSRGDAQFVDVIHSNCGSLGKRDPLGDVDFYPNGLDPLPPGCFDIMCAHLRAYEFYAESVYPGNENGFLGVKCQSMFALNSGFCKGKGEPMGFATVTTLKGNYFLKTAEKSPFGEKSTNPTTVTCNNEDGSMS